MYGLLAQPLKRKTKNLIFSPFQFISLSTWQPNLHRAGRSGWHHSSEEQAEKGFSSWLWPPFAGWGDPGRNLWGVAGEYPQAQGAERVLSVVRRGLSRGCIASDRPGDGHRHMSPPRGIRSTWTRAGSGKLWNWSWKGLWTLLSLFQILECWHTHFNLKEAGGEHTSQRIRDQWLVLCCYNLTPLVTWHPVRLPSEECQELCPSMATSVVLENTEWPHGTREKTGFPLQVGTLPEGSCSARGV